MGGLKETTDMGIGEERWGDRRGEESFWYLEFVIGIGIGIGIAF